MSAKQLTLGSCGALALVAWAAVAHAADATDSPGPKAGALSCAALGGDTHRLAAKFSLGLAACARGADPAPPRTAAQVQAQQLYLYDTDSPAAAAPLPAPAPSSAPGPRSPAKPAWLRLSTQGQRALQLAPIVDATARSRDIDPLLLHAIAHVESRHDAAAISSAGALGVMQVMPATASRFGATPTQMLHHAPTNVDVGAAYLKTLQQRFGNDLTLVLAAYNAGEGAVQKAGNQIPNYKETQNYVKTVMQLYQMLKPPVAQPEPRHTLSRVRPVIKGGALNRGNMVSGVPPSPAQTSPRSGFDPQ